MFGNFGKLMKNLPKIKELAKEGKADRKKLHKTPFTGASKDGLVKVTELGNSVTQNVSVDASLANNTDKIANDVKEANNAADKAIGDADKKVMQKYSQYEDLLPSGIQKMIKNN